jgi:hypothetical protein
LFLEGETLKKIKIMAIVTALTLASIIFNNVQAQFSDEMQTFFYRDYAGITIRVNATNETLPDGNLTVRLWLNCTAVGVYINYLNLTIYGFKEGEQKISLNNTCLLENSQLPFNFTEEYEVVVHVPENVWGTAYLELRLEYSIVDLPLKYGEGFSITAIKNIEFENLKKEYQELNQTFWESFGKNLTRDDLLSLNATYWELLQNYTTLERSINELNNTRMAVGVLAVTTIFFVATTAYLIMRKPKSYW